MFVDPPPARVTPSKLRAELLAAGVPLEPAKPYEALDCQSSGGKWAVVILAETDQWDALTRQVVGAHVPDPLETRKQRRKRLLDALIDAQDELQIVLQLAEAQESLKLYQALRLWNNQLRTQLMNAGLPLTVPVLPGKTWAEHKADVLATARAIIDAEPN